MVESLPFRSVDCEYYVKCCRSSLLSSSKKKNNNFQFCFPYWLVIQVGLGVEGVVVTAESVCPNQPVEFC